MSSVSASTAARSSLRYAGQQRRHRQRLADDQQHARAKQHLALVEQADRQHAQAGRALSAADSAMRAAPVLSGRICGSECETPSGNSASASPARQRRAAAREALLVARGVLVRPTPSPGRPGCCRTPPSPGGPRVAEQRALGQEPRRPPGHDAHEQRIEQPVGMIGDEDHRPLARQALRSLDAAMWVVKADQRLGEPADDGLEKRGASDC